MEIVSQDSGEICNGTVNHHAILFNDVYVDFTFGEPNAFSCYMDLFTWLECVAMTDIFYLQTTNVTFHRAFRGS